MLRSRAFSHFSASAARLIAAVAILLLSLLPPNAAPAAAQARPETTRDEPPYLVLTLDDGLEAGVAAKPGQAITYTFGISNPTASAVTNVRLVAIVPQHTRPAPDGVAEWECYAAPMLGNQQCEQRIGGVAGKYTTWAQLPVTVDAPLPAATTAITLVAAVSADEIVCGECGLAMLETPVDAGASLLPGARVYLPVVGR